MNAALRLLGLAITGLVALQALAGCGKAEVPVPTDIAAIGSNNAVAAEVLAAPVPAGVDPALWETLTRELARKIAARGASSYGASASWMAFFVYSMERDEQSYIVWNNSFFHWDGSGDGVVGVSDITPLARHFGESVSDVPAAGVADYNGDGEVGIADITPLAVHFGEQCTDFIIQKSWVSRGSGYIDVETIGYEDNTGVDEHGFGVYEVPVDFGEIYPLWVRAIASDEEGNVLVCSSMLWRAYPCEANTPPFPVDDLEIVRHSPPTVTWTTHFFEADGDQSGMTNIADATPMAVVFDEFGEGCSVSEVPQAAVADYDRNGFVESVDLRVLAESWGWVCMGYCVEVSTDSYTDGYVTDGLLQYEDSASETDGGFRRYEYTINLPPAGVPFWVRVIPFDDDSKLGVPCAPVYFPTS